MNKEVYSRTKNSKDNYETPPYFFNFLNENIKFTLDPCSSDENHLCDKYYTIKDDGLKQDWKGECVFVNPPYSNIKEWSKKCYEEGQKENTVVIMLIPSRTDTRYWHDYIMKASSIWFCKGRVNFLLNGIKPKGGSPFPSAVIFFRQHLKENPDIKTLEHKHLEAK